MSREEIISRIKKANENQKVNLPKIEKGIFFEDAIVSFGENLKLVGGQTLAADEVESYLQNLENKFGPMQFMNSYLSSQFENSMIPIELNKPHDANRLDVLVSEALYGIAENGALWVEEPAQFPRSSLFLAQHLILYLKKSKIYNNLHEFYNEVNVHKNNFGTLVSGPSKTADVEQSLVIGAHGARSLAVVLIE